MCIGTPMQVRARLPGGLYAECSPWAADAEGSESSSVCEKVDVQLVGEVRPGDWLLVFLGAAREVLTPERAHSVGRALMALQRFQSSDVGFSSQAAGAAASSDSLDANHSVALGAGLFDDLFPDLNREPELPAHLQQVFLAQQTTQEQTGRVGMAGASEAGQPNEAQTLPPQQGLPPLPEEPGE